jgi:hypothetical protein
MVVQEELEEQLAAARKVPNVAKVQLPDQQVEAPAYVKSNSPAGGENKTVAENQTGTTNPQIDSSIAANLRPIDTSVKTLQIAPTADSSERKLNAQETSLKSNAPTADLQIIPGLTEMKTGERVKLAVQIKSATAFRSAVLGFKFDQNKIAVRNVTFGDVFGSNLAQTTVTPFLNQNGKMYVSLSSPKDVAENSTGILAYIEVEALADGKPEISFESDIMNLLTAEGKNFAVRF